MKKVNGKKMLGFVLTLALLAQSVFAAAIPVSAADDTDKNLVTPGSGVADSWLYGDSKFAAGLISDGNYETEGITGNGSEGAGGDNSWFYVTMEKPVRVDRIKLYWGDTYGAQYEIQTRLRDEPNFHTVYVQNNGTGGEEEIVLDVPVVAEVVKIQGIF